MRNSGIGVVVMIAVAAGSLLTAGCHGSDGKVPDVLLGVWTSSSPGYSDRYIEIRPDSITFGTGGTTSVRYEIRGCERNQTPDGPLYVLEFEGTSGGAFRRPLYYSPEGGGRLKFKNEPAVTWVKTS
jgi:hypothetical protein